MTKKVDINHARRHFLQLAALGGASTAALSMMSVRTLSAEGEAVVRIGMSIANLPTASGQPDQGSQGVMFTGLTMYDPLVTFDFTAADHQADIVPALAESWQIDPDDKKRWIFKLREDVKFHDGSKFNADSVIWNFEKLFNKDAPQYDRRQVAQVIWRMGNIEGYRKLSEYEVEFTTKVIDAFLPYQLSYTYFSSPAQWEAVGRDWQKFSEAPSGTGPWKLDKIVPRERIELIPNKQYWNEAYLPRTDRLVLIPMPESTSRVAALLSGQVDWIESVPPDSIPQLEASGKKVVTNAYPHIWPYMLNWLEHSPTSELRIRKALNLAIDRESLVDLLGGYAIVAKGQVMSNSKWFGDPDFKVEYDPDEARRLLAEVGYGPDNPLEIDVLTAPSGGGQIQPVLMNEFIQQNYRDVGIKLNLVVREWETMRSQAQLGPEAPENAEIDGVNWSWATFDPNSAFVRFFDSSLTLPNGQNWGHVSDAELDELMARAKKEFDLDERDRLLRKVHERIVDLAAWVWVVHDVDKRGLSENLEWTPTQAWVQQFSTIEEVN